MCKSRLHVARFKYVLGLSAIVNPLALVGIGNHYCRESGCRHVRQHPQFKACHHG
jgi:hypothetical protein